MSDSKGKKRKISFSEFSYLLIILVIFLLDQLIKKIVTLFFLPGEGFPVINPIFHITLVFNKGIAFGLFPNIPLFFTILATIFFIFFLFISQKSFSTKLKKLAISLISAGALSNLFDRISLGYVVDYLDFRIFPVFNLGDASISMGIALLFLETIRKKCVL